MDLSLTLAETVAAAAAVIGCLILILIGVALAVAAIRNEPIFAPPEFDDDPDEIVFVFPRTPLLWRPYRPFNHDVDRWDW